MDEFKPTKEQQAAINAALDPATLHNPTAISGPAGSGKTLVALEIAKRLSSQQQLVLADDAPQSLPVYLVTYTNELCDYVKSQLGQDSPIEVMTVHAYLKEFMKHNRCVDFTFNGSRVTEVPERDEYLHGYIDEHAKEQGLSGCLADASFLNEEMRWMLGRGLRSLSAYMGAPRTGRRTRISAGQREKVFSILKAYMGEVTSKKHGGKKIVDFDDIGNQVLNVCRTKEVGPIASHLVVDEVQDLPITWTDALKQTAAGKIVYVGDASQSIYGRGFTWHELTGRNTRPIHLSEDFRNTKQIYEAARSLMDFDHEDDTETGNKEQRRREGAKPELVLCADGESQACAIRKRIEERLRENQEDTIAVGFPRRNGYFWQLANQYPKNGRVTITTLHSLKGIEASHVILANLDNDELHFNNRYTEEDTDRHLLYVGMTRGKKTLALMTATSKPVWLLSELDLDLVELDGSENQLAVQSLASNRRERQQKARESFTESVKREVEQEEKLEEILEAIDKVAAHASSESEPTSAQQEATDTTDATDTVEVSVNEQDAIPELSIHENARKEKNKELEAALKEIAQLKHERELQENDLRVYRARERAAEAAGLEGDASGSKQHEFFDDAKILIIGASGIKSKDIPGCFKNANLPRDAYKLIDYDDVHSGKFKPGSLLGAMCYSDIFIGATPHKAKDIGSSSSLIEWLEENKDNLPKLMVFRNSDGTPKMMSKTDLKEALFNSALYAKKMDLGEAV